MSAVSGLVARRFRWGLTWRGRVLLGIGIVAVVAGGGPRLYRFLAITERVDSEILVVEGWMHGYGIRAGAEEFRKGGYRRVISTGGPVSGEFTNIYNTSANVGAESLERSGLERSVIDVVPAASNGRDRTYHSALALRDALRDLNPPVKTINVLTENVHARRSRLLYQQALGEDIRVGVIAVPDPDVDPGRWWRYSEGVKDVISEGAAYLYAKFVFRPGMVP